MKGRIPGVLTIILLCLSFPAVLFAEIIVLKSEEIIDGAIRDISADSVKIELNGETSTIPFTDIKSINGVSLDDDIGISDEDCGLREPPFDGIYKMDGVTIKLLCPPGWKSSESRPGLEGTLSFMPACLDLTNLTVSLSRVSPEINLESAKQEFEKDSSCLSSEIISFAGKKALKSIIIIAGIKTQQLMFSRDGHLFILTFAASSEDDFDKYLSDINQSLGSFEIVT